VGRESHRARTGSIGFILSRIKAGSELILPAETKEWIEGGQTKVCLSVESEEQLIDIYQQAKNMGLEAHIITDAGRTEFNGNPTKTSVAIGPNKSEEIDKITGHLSLR